MLRQREKRFAHAPLLKRRRVTVGADGGSSSNAEQPNLVAQLMIPALQNELAAAHELIQSLSVWNPAHPLVTVLRSASTTAPSTTTTNTTTAAAATTSSTHNPMALSLPKAGSVSGEEFATTSYHSKEEEQAFIQVRLCECI